MDILNASNVTILFCDSKGFMAIENVGMESAKYLNDHFKNLITTDSGVSSVDGENEVLIAKMIEVALSKFIGLEGCNYIMVTGSASQNLRCVTDKDRGDIDLVLLSHHPPITEEEQNELFIPCEEPGFYQVKVRDGMGNVYPSVQRLGCKLLDAKSLRDFEKVWFPGSLSVPLQVLGSVESGYERAGVSKLATSVFWRSTYRKRDQIAIDQSFYFMVLIKSYKENILPLLDTDGTKLAHKVLHTISTLVEFAAFYCIEECALAIKTLEKLGDGFKDGFLHFLFEYVCEVQKIDFPFINERNIEIFKKAYAFFESSSQTEYRKENISKDGEVYGSLDLVPGISCEGFPQIAQTWLDRVRGKVWPTSEVVDKIVKAGFQLVPKSSKAVDNDAHTSFRLSFNTAEQLLAQCLTKFQRECYRVLKMYYYEILKKDPKVLTTYHLKTVLFWVIEKSGTEIWVEDNRAECCMLLLKYLRNSLSCRDLQHYFIPGCNLLKYLDSSELEKDVNNLKVLIDDPTTASRRIIDRIKECYSTYQVSAGEGILKSDLIEDFLQEQLVQFEQVHSDFIDSILIAVDDEEYCIDFLLQMTKPETISVLKFCFDLISARNKQAWRQSHDYAPLPSTFAVLLMMLPGAREIMEHVLTPIFDQNSQAAEQLKIIQSWLKLAGRVDFKDIKSFLGVMKWYFELKK